MRTRDDFVRESCVSRKLRKELRHAHNHRRGVYVTANITVRAWGRLYISRHLRAPEGNRVLDMSIVRYKAYLG